MNRVINFIGLIFILTFSVCCKKGSINTFDCSNLQQGIKSDKVDLVNNEINIICVTLSKPAIKEKVEKLAEIISSKCNMKATVFCTECIKTMPTQSEIIISFSISGIEYLKVIDIISRDPLEFAGIHD